MTDAQMGTKCHITFEKLSGSATTEVHSQITSFDGSGNETNSEAIYVFGGGSFTKDSPATELEVSFDVVLSSTTAQSILSAALGASSTESSVITWKSSNVISKYRITIMTTDGTYNTASPAVPVTGEAWRYTYVAAKKVTFEVKSEADGYTEGTLSFKLTPTDSNANPQYIVEYTSNAATTAFGNPYGTAGVRQAYGSYA